jgi:hypothetical protein
VGRLTGDRPLTGAPTRRMFSLEDPSPDLPGCTRTTPVDRPIGQLIQSADAGNRAATDQLFAALYRELHTIAERELHRGGDQLTLGTTTLLHEAYLNIARREGVQFASRPQFLAYAARAMRGLVGSFTSRLRGPTRPLPTKFSPTSWRSSSPPSRPLPGSIPNWHDWWISIFSLGSLSRSWPSCAACPSARCSATGGRLGCCCTEHYRHHSPHPVVFRLSA